MSRAREARESGPRHTLAGDKHERVCRVSVAAVALDQLLGKTKHSRAALRHRVRRRRALSLPVALSFARFSIRATPSFIGDGRDDPSAFVTERSPDESARFRRVLEPGVVRPVSRQRGTPKQPRDTTQTMLRRAHCQSMRRALAPNKEIPLSPLLFHGDAVSSASSSGGRDCSASVRLATAKADLDNGREIRRSGISRLDIIGWRGKGEGDDGRTCSAQSRSTYRTDAKRRQLFTAAADRNRARRTECPRRAGGAADFSRCRPDPSRSRRRTSDERDPELPGSTPP